MSRTHVLAVVLLSSWCVIVDAAIQPTLTEILERHFEALGGRDRIAAIRTLEKTGTYIYNGQEHPLRSFHATGQRFREEIEGLVIWGAEVQDAHVVVRGTDGSSYWMKDATRYGRFNEVADARATLTLQEADLHGALFEHQRKGHRVAYDGLGEVEGAPAHRLRVELASGFELIHFIDASSFLLLKIEVATAEDERDLEHPRAWFFDDYRPVDGVWMPFWIYVEEPIFSREYVLETIEANVPIDDAMFEAPIDAIRSR